MRLNCYVLVASLVAHVPSCARSSATLASLFFSSARRNCGQTRQGNDLNMPIGSYISYGAQAGPAEPSAEGAGTRTTRELCRLARAAGSWPGGLPH
jgi:hypothetical protein